MASIAVPATTSLSETERKILGLYDQLQQLQLELALLQSRQSHYASAKGSSDTRAPGQDLARYQGQLLEAKAALDLRNSVVENAVVVQPTLNAVHHATQASSVEQALLADIEQRDKVTITAATICSELQAARRRLAELETQRLQASRRNAKLSSEVLRLAGKTQDQEPKKIEGGPLEREIEVLESQVKASRHRWRVMKGAASAIVAGSGADWVRDERLKELVLDPRD
ncbi:hypothetical protein VTI74DRAFT_9649 [Chaetomium olivicolor]